MDLKQLQVKPADRELVRSIHGVRGGGGGGWPPGGGGQRDSIIRDLASDPSASLFELAIVIWDDQKNYHFGPFYTIFRPF